MHVQDYVSRGQYRKQRFLVQDSPPSSERPLDSKKSALLTVVLISLHVLAKTLFKLIS